MKVHDACAERVAPANHCIRDEDIAAALERVEQRSVERVEVFLRGDNVLNRHYQEVLGFGTPGAAVYVGASVEF